MNRLVGSLFAWFFFWFLPAWGVPVLVILGFLSGFLFACACLEFLR